MSKKETFKKFVAEGIRKENNTLDLDTAYVKVEELWHNAAILKDKNAQMKIGYYARKYREG